MAGGGRKDEYGETMSVRNKVKDHLKIHGGVELLSLPISPTSDDSLRFWTNHPTHNCLVDLHEFVEGVFEKPNRGTWSGPFAGRPELISELAPGLQARLTLANPATCSHFKQALRTFWRICDQLELMEIDGRKVTPLTSAREITHLHEAMMNRSKITYKYTSIILNLLNDARRLMRIGRLAWTIPRPAEPIRHLISDEMAKAIKIGIKRDWERIRKSWERHDAILRGEEPNTLTEYQKQNAEIVIQYTEENKKLRLNWSHHKRIQISTGMVLPSSDLLHEGRTRKALSWKGIGIIQMRAIAFPTIEEAYIAFHSALMGSGWNTSTLINGIDATMPNRIFQHPKDAKQSVLVADVLDDPVGDMTKNIEVTMQGSKARAGGRMQFCMGLKKNPDSPPMVVAAFLERTTGLREQLRQDVKKAYVELARLRTEQAPREATERQFKRLQTLQQGFRNVWLYVGIKGDINWINGKNWDRMNFENVDGKVTRSYLDNLIARLNSQRLAHGDLPISRIVPSDFRDIFARWVYVQTGGNIIAVMFALGHSSLRPTNGYLDNNIFNADNDEVLRRFMTHLFNELKLGRVDLTILAQLVRHGPMTQDMQECLSEYRSLMRSRVNVGCLDPKNPPTHIEPNHVEGKWCGTHRCLRDCPNARFLPDSLQGIAMRVEELLVMSLHLPLDTWVMGEFEKELEAGEYLLKDLYQQDAVYEARSHWFEKIRSGKHVVPGVGIMRN